ncbi:MAG: hypothetical protein WCC25_07880, partial [Candidatus Korobacteraceae bacterium]
DPFTIGRPSLAELRDVEPAIVIGVDQHGLGIVEVDKPQIQTLVAVGDFLAVGLPRRRVEK